MQGGKHHYLAHHGLINLIVLDALESLQDLVSWIDFIYMDREVFLETQVKPRLGLEGVEIEEEIEAEVEGELTLKKRNQRENNRKK